MKIKTETLLADLKQRTEYCIKNAKFLQIQDEKQLQIKPHPKAWNAIECLEHLNYYAAFYHPRIQSKLDHSNYKAKTHFKSSWIGERFARAVHPDAKPMNTLRKTNPLDREETLVSNQTLRRFLSRQEELLQFIEQAQSTNLEKVKVSISIAPLLKVRLGDVLNFNVLHNQRHIHQALRVAQMEE